MKANILLIHGTHEEELQGMCAMQGGDDECEDGHNGVAATWMKLFARRWTRRWL